MQKKILSLFLSFIVIIPYFFVTGNAIEITVSAKSAILIDANTFEVLYAKNENEKRGIASTTKILTSLIALEYGAPQKEFVASKEAVTVEGTSIGLKSGDKITIKALVYGMLLESGNDAANVTAYGISGNITEFSKLMNSYAEKIGMNDSNFTNPSGLTDENHYSTAYDMALLTSVAIKNPVFKKICSTESAVIDFGTPEISRTLSNHNRLLRECEGVFGVKTGYTKASGRCLVTACERNGITLIAVTLNAYDDWNDHKKLYDFGFSFYDNELLQIDLENVSVPVICADKKSVSVMAAFQPDFKANGSYKSEIYVEQFLYPPVKKGDIVGYLVYYDKKDRVVKEIPLISLQNATSLYKEIEVKNSLLQRIKKFIEGLSM